LLPSTIAAVPVLLAMVPVPMLSIPTMVPAAISAPAVQLNELSPVLNAPPDPIADPFHSLSWK
jgi:hypothetical protein